MYRNGTFAPWNLERMIEVVKEAVVQFERADIPITRVGLHLDQSLLENYVDGPFHPSFRYLVDSRIARDQMINMIRALKQVPTSVTFRVPAKKLSNFVGHKKENLSIIKRIFGLESINVQQGARTECLVA
jgi:histone acetyltransferase (RNA polymerase elongator complex component)